MTGLNARAAVRQQNFFFHHVEWVMFKHKGFLLKIGELK